MGVDPAKGGATVIFRPPEVLNWELNCPPIMSRSSPLSPKS